MFSLASQSFQQVHFEGKKSNKSYIHQRQAQEKRDERAKETEEKERQENRQQRAYENQIAVEKQRQEKLERERQIQIQAEQKRNEKLDAFSRKTRNLIEISSRAFHPDNQVLAVPGEPNMNYKDRRFLEAIDPPPGSFLPPGLGSLGPDLTSRIRLPMYRYHSRMSLVRAQTNHLSSQGSLKALEKEHKDLLEESNSPELNLSDHSKWIVQQQLLISKGKVAKRLKPITELEQQKIAHGHRISKIPVKAIRSRLLPWKGLP